VALLARATLTPPAAAAWDNATVQIDVVPETRLAGAQETELRVVALETTRVSDVSTEAPFKLAVTMAVCPIEKTPAVAVNVADMEPAGIGTLAGTVKTGRLLESVTVAPPEPAAWAKLTVQADVVPEFSADGAQDTDVKAGVPAEPTVALNSTGANPLTAAITFAIAPTDPAPNVKVTDACPAASLTAVSEDTYPLPCVTAKCTTAFGITLPAASSTNAAKGAGSGAPVVPVWPDPEAIWS
jgi:hypothetical protein